MRYCIYRVLRQRLRLCSSRVYRAVSSSSKHRILGIETSCDDTGAAVVDECGNILGNALYSQTTTSVAMGGVLPPYAKALHKKHIDSIISQALTQAGLDAKDLDAVAVTVEPGLALCLDVGLTHAKALVQEHRLPMIPIHHMEAHALTARMIDRVDFPFLVFLASGGHCLLAVAREVDDFLMLGSSTDNSPGEVFDKLARTLKLKSLPACAGLSGGAMIEKVALDGDPSVFACPDVNLQVSSCNFSFGGLKAHYIRYVKQEEEREGVVGCELISSYSDICASFQQAVLRHMARTLYRALIFCELRQLLPDAKTVVFSGGVACNQYLRTGIQKVCDVNSARLVVPPPALCTDNGIMIAWNGMEKFLQGKGVVEDAQAVCFKPKSPFGRDLSAEVAQSTIKVPRLRL